MGQLNASGVKGVEQKGQNLASMRNDLVNIEQPAYPT
ncbi:hypothetical protein ZBT109_2239 [Zymobacter palmae]|uniref:Uncharacterized protein n=1 Tax=Zymobacter palmae TaxID=33074 RepID=A0A348HH69_9GAMM|nr:hypothetical protein ZBT109_2239 [Zymobacter palmae]